MRSLGTLGVEIVRIGITSMRSPEAELERLSECFPAAIFDRQHLFRLASLGTAPDCF